MRKTETSFWTEPPTRLELPDTITRLQEEGYALRSGRREAGSREVSAVKQGRLGTGGREACPGHNRTQWSRILKEEQTETVAFSPPQRSYHTKNS